jgi:SEC-C motif domain protein
MRSRYTAHVVHDFEYLHRTYQPTSTLPYVPEPEEPAMQWTRLEVHAHELGPKPETAYVDFTAYYLDGGKEQALHEKAEFHQVDRQWLYTRPVRQGPAPRKSSAPKVGRNDPCPCGSGRKYKHCCGR